MRIHVMRHSVGAHEDGWKLAKKGLEIAVDLAAVLATAAIVTVLAWRWVESFGSSYASFF